MPRTSQAIWPAAARESSSRWKNEAGDSNQVGPRRSNPTLDKPAAGKRATSTSAAEAESWPEVPGACSPKATLRLPVGQQVQSSPQLTPPRTPQEAVPSTPEFVSRAVASPYTTPLAGNRAAAHQHDGTARPRHSSHKHRLPGLIGSTVHPPRSAARSRIVPMADLSITDVANTSSSSMGPREAHVPPFAASGHGINLRATVHLPASRHSSASRHPSREQSAGGLHHEEPFDEVPAKISMREFLSMHLDLSRGEAPTTPPPLSRSLQHLNLSIVQSVQEEPLDASTGRHGGQESSDRLPLSPFNALPPLAHASPPERQHELESSQPGAQGRGDGLRQFPQPRARTTRIKVAAEPGFSLPTGNGKAPELGSMPSPLRLPLQIRPRARSVFGGDLGGFPMRSPKLGWEEGQQVHGRESSDLALEEAATDVSAGQTGRQRWRRQP